MTNLDTSIDLAEYEGYLESDFDPIRFANGLLLGVSAPQDMELDIGTPINKLSFDLNDVNKLIMDKISTEKGLTSHLNTLEELNGKLDTKIEPAITQLQRSFDRLDQSVITPYEQCLNINMALKKIHATNKLLRASTVALYLLAKVKEVQEGGDNLKSLLILSKLIEQFELHIENFAFLNSLKTINTQAKEIESLKKKLTQQALNEIKKMSVYTTTTKNSEIKFEINSAIINDKRLLGYLFESLSILDSFLLVSSVLDLFKSTVQQSIQLITKNINNSKHIANIIRGFQSTANNLTKIQEAIPKDIWKEISTKLETNEGGLNVKFWVELSIGVDPKFKDVIQKGGPVARNLKAVYGDIEKSIRDVVPRGYNVELIVLNALKVI